jgi:starvation-inducible DNA-binding protein
LSAQRLHCRAGFVGQPTPNLGDSPMQPTHNTLSQNIRAQSVELLNKHPAAIDLHAQVKQAHWNVHGPGFIAIHELFDKASGEGESYSDLIAEHAGGLGGAAYGTVQVAAERSFLVPYPHGIANEQEHVFAVSGTLAAFGQSAREAIDQATILGDADTADLFTEISRAWTINCVETARAHCNGGD